jgi:hypothetical protein
MAEARRTTRQQTCSKVRAALQNSTGHWISKNKPI